MIDLARREKIEVREEGVALADFRKATEVFLTGTVAELVAVTTLDNRPIGTGKPGEITRRLRAAYDEYVRSFRSQH
ncbi:MAG: hypothetical protein M5R36_21155 [Deltaproteobacteria bacterium]|nr:hypothetical protein [Deltaproteobacteria bacterium]